MAVALASVPAALAQEPVPPPPDTAAQTAPRWSVKPFPSSDIYLPYVADPHRATNALSEAAIIDGGIPFTQGPLSRLSTGGRFGMVRLDPATPGGRAWQLSVDAGFDAIFDSNNRLDVVGWDGNYGLTLTTASSSRLSWKFAVLHVSAHVGDEYQDRTDHDRINYTREEVSAGAAWRFTPSWRAYGETGVAYHMGHESLEPWRVQWGVEYEPGLARQAVGALVRGRQLRGDGRAGVAGGRDRGHRGGLPHQRPHDAVLPRVARRPADGERVLHERRVEPHGRDPGRPVTA